MGIPKIIHQIWISSKDSQFQGYPENRPTYQKYAKSWQEHHPDYQYQLWNNRQVEELLATPGYERWRDFYHTKIQRHIEKCDFARYLILYNCGGIYADLDFECRRSLEPLRGNRELGLVPEVAEHQFFYKEMICNSFIMSIAKHPIWRQVLDEIVSNYKPTNSVPENTGPCVLTRIIPLTDANRIPSCSIIPYTYYEHRSWNCTPEQAEQAYTYPHWTEGTYWWLEDVERWLATINSCWPILLLLAFILISLFLA